MRLAAGSALGAAEEVVELVAESTADSAELLTEEAVLSASSLEQAATPKRATAANPATAAVLR
jgi:hypothetical protein